MRIRKTTSVDLLGAFGRFYDPPERRAILTPDSGRSFGFRSAYNADRGCSEMTSRSVALVAVVGSALQLKPQTQDDGLQVVNSKRRLALVIGNQAYAKGPLKNPKNDADAVRRVLVDFGFEVGMAIDADRGAFDRDKAILLEPDVPDNYTLRAEIRGMTGDTVGSSNDTQIADKLRHR